MAGEQESQIGNMNKKIFFYSILIILFTLSCTNIAEQLSWDITQNKSNSLSKESMLLLDQIHEQLTITVYCRDIKLLNLCKPLLMLYKKYSANIHIEFATDPPATSDINKLKLYTDNNITITYKGIQQSIDIAATALSEQNINATIQRLMHNADAWIVFLAGHQEANPLDTSEFGLSEFAQLSVKQGMRIATINLAQQPMIPQNTSLLIIANPQQVLLPIEQTLIHKYIQDGGHVVWLTEPDARISATIAEEFGIIPSKGVAIDQESTLLGSPHPAIKILTQYTQHQITQDFSGATILPWSAHLRILQQPNNWQQNVFLTTKPTTWTYNGPITNNLNSLSKYKEFTGPLNLAIALSRTHNDTKQEQRALIIADSSFMLNKYLGKYANRQLASNMLSWVQTRENMIVYNTTPIKDLSYYPSKFSIIMYQYIFTIIIPIALIGIGLYQNKRKTG